MPEVNGTGTRGGSRHGEERFTKIASQKDTKAGRIARLRGVMRFAPLIRIYRLPRLLGATLHKVAVELGETHRPPREEVVRAVPTRQCCAGLRLFQGRTRRARRSRGLGRAVRLGLLAGYLPGEQRLSGRGRVREGRVWAIRDQVGGGGLAERGSVLLVSGEVAWRWDGSPPPAGREGVKISYSRATGGDFEILQVIVNNK